MSAPIVLSFRLSTDSLKRASMDRSPSEMCLPDAPCVRMLVRTLASRRNWYGMKG